MKSKILTATLGVIVMTGCAPSFVIDKNLEAQNSARIKNAVAKDYTLNTQKAYLTKVDGDTITEIPREFFHFVKSGRRQLTARCFYKLSSFKSYIGEETITADLVKGRSYELFPIVDLKKVPKDETCKIGIRDITAE